jgi:hypothetical protein
MVANTIMNTPAILTAWTLVMRTNTALGSVYKPLSISRSASSACAASMEPGEAPAEKGLEPIPHSRLRPPMPPSFTRS